MDPTLQVVLMKVLMIDKAIAKKITSKPRYQPDTPTLLADSLPSESPEKPLIHLAYQLMKTVNL